MTSKVALASIVAIVVVVAAFWVSARSTTATFLARSGQAAGMPGQGKLFGWAVIGILVVNVALGAAVLGTMWRCAVVAICEIAAALVFLWAWRYHYGIRSDTWGNDYVADAVGTAIFGVPWVVVGLGVGTAVSTTRKHRNEPVT